MFDKCICTKIGKKARSNTIWLYNLPYDVSINYFYLPPDVPIVVTIDEVVKVAADDPLV